MKKVILFCLGATLLVSACNTVNGLGKDIQNAGDSISKSTK